MHARVVDVVTTIPFLLFIIISSGTVDEINFKLILFLPDSLSNNYFKTAILIINPLKIVYTL